jgi:uncharacterized membrane protein YkvA (DUF1232 family)
MKLPHAHRGRPLARLAGTVARLPRYLRVATSLVQDPTVPVHRKAALGLGLGYVISPVDLIPGIIPVLGQLDDLTALLLALRTTLSACTPEHAAEHLEHAGLSASALDADIRTVQVAAVWLVASAAALAIKPVRALFRRRGGPEPLIDSERSDAA